MKYLKTFESLNTDSDVEYCLQTLIDDFGLTFEPRDIHGFNYVINEEFEYSEELLAEIKKAIAKLGQIGYKVRVFYQVYMNGTNNYIEATKGDVGMELEVKLKEAIDKVIEESPIKRIATPLVVNRFIFRVMTEEDYNNF